MPQHSKEFSGIWSFDISNIIELFGKFKEFFWGCIWPNTEVQLGNQCQSKSAFLQVMTPGGIRRRESAKWHYKPFDAIPAAGVPVAPLARRNRGMPLLALARAAIWRSSAVA